MAILTATDPSSSRFPFGDKAIVIKQVTLGTTPATDEWFDSGLSYVEGIVGHAVIGAADAGVNFVLREQGTSGSEAADDSAVGIEGTVTGAVVQVAVIGKV